MLGVQILEEEDQIEPTDWCRPLVLVSMSGGISDGYSFTSIYSGKPENNVKWAPVSDVFGPGWFGRPVKEINTTLDIPYEFIRGKIPKSHSLKKGRRS